MGCGKPLPPGAAICVNCGTDLVTGQRLVTTEEFGDDEGVARTRDWVAFASRIVPVGFCPVGPEPYAVARPYATWVLLLATLLVGVACFVLAHGRDDASPHVLNLTLWTGSREVTDKKMPPLIDFYARQLRASITRTSKDGTTTAQDEQRIRTEAPRLAAQYWGAPQGVDFHLYQLVTHPLTHDAANTAVFIVTLAVDLLFLLAFGLRVNALVGNGTFAVVYPLLAAASALVDRIAHAGQPLHASSGAAGAIMGLAGMCLVFFPVARVHPSCWLRLGGRGVASRVFNVSGLWLLVAWVAVAHLLASALAGDEPVNHWPHLGGFAAGVALAVALLVTRRVNAHGRDLFSLALGPRAALLIGKPRPGKAGPPPPPPAASSGAGANAVPA
jgi:membrane associated rhomboid family serine protease